MKWKYVGLAILAALGLGGFLGYYVAGQGTALVEAAQIGGSAASVFLTVALVVLQFSYTKATKRYVDLTERLVISNRALEEIQREFQRRQRARFEVLADSVYTEFATDGESDGYIQLDFEITNSGWQDSAIRSGRVYLEGTRPCEGHPLTDVQRALSDGTSTSDLQVRVGSRARFKAMVYIPEDWEGKTARLEVKPVVGEGDNTSFYVGDASEGHQAYQQKGYPGMAYGPLRDPAQK